MNRKNLYLAFPDNLIAYDCKTCIHKYCLGCTFPGTLSLDKYREYPFLLKNYPYLGYFVFPVMNIEDGYGLFGEHYSPGCWFFNSQGKCDIELKFGRKYKPIICRSFPFSAGFRVKDTLIINLHPQLLNCPLKLAPGRGITHKEIKKEIKGFKNYCFLHANFKAHSALSENLEDFLRTEKYLRDRCLGFIDKNNYTDFAIFQLSLILKSNKKLLKAKKELEETLNIWREFLELPRDLSFENKRLSSMLVALTPSLRAKYILNNASRTYRQSLSILPKMLLALYVYLILFENVNKRQSNLSTILDMFKINLNTFYMLSFINKIPYLEPHNLEPPKEKFDERYPYSLLFNQKRFHHIVTEESLKKKLSLAKIITDRLKIDRGIDRLFFIKSILKGANDLKFK